jgi:5'(3')-deoxyribonucleotidase
MLKKLAKKRRWTSDKLVQYVDIVFGVVVGQSIIRYIDLIQNPLSHSFASTALLVVIITVGLSWIGYHKSMYDFPYKADNLSFASLTKSVSIFRPFVDFLIVVLYNYFLFTIDTFKVSPAVINLFPFIASYVLFFAIYYFDGVIRIVEYKNRLASHLDLSLRYLIGYLVLLGSYVGLIYYLTHLAPSTFIVSVINWLYLVACGFSYVRYRRAREPHYTPMTPLSMKKLTIVVDVDGVLADQVTQVLDALNSKYGSHYVKADIRHWDEPLPLAHTDIKTAIESSHNDPNVVTSMNTIQNAPEVMRELSKYCEIWIATNRTAIADKPTREWLRKCNIPYEPGHYHNTSIEGKGVIQGDIIIDDYPKNVLAFTSKPDRKGIILTQPWNESDESLIDNENIYRAKDWLDVWRIINSLDSLPF